MSDREFEDLISKPTSPVVSFGKLLAGGFFALLSIWLIAINVNALIQMLECSLWDKTQGKVIHSSTIETKHEPDSTSSGNDKYKKSFSYNLDVKYEFADVADISKIRIVFDSNLNRGLHNMPCFFPLAGHPKYHVPETLVKEFVVEYLDENDNWQTAFESDNNYQRLVKIPVDINAKAVKLTVKATHGVDIANIFSFEVK